MVYTDADLLLRDLGEYMRDPHAKEKAVMASAVNKRLVRDMPPLPEPTGPRVTATELQAGLARVAEPAVGANPVEFLRARG
jgi:hypothetical protein